LDTPDAIPNTSYEEVIDDIKTSSENDPSKVIAKIAEYDPELADQIKSGTMPDYQNE
jgi:hypothetical protein